MRGRLLFPKATVNRNGSRLRLFFFFLAGAQDRGGEEVNTNAHEAPRGLALLTAHTSLTHAHAHRSIVNHCKK